MSIIDSRENIKLKCTACNGNILMLHYIVLKQRGDPFTQDFPLQYCFIIIMSLRKLSNKIEFLENINKAHLKLMCL